MILRSGTVFMESGVFQRADVALDAGRILAVGSVFETADEVLDCTGQYLIPGLVDIHTHGAVGADFSDGDTDGNARMAACLLRHGVTSYLGTSMSLPEDMLARGFALAKKQIGRQDPTRAAMRGINMEGPFLSLAKCGAQNAAHLRNPDFSAFERLNKASGGNIRIVDVAPELPGAAAFIRSAAPFCTVSLAHTDADYETAAAAYRAGATHATHLFNGMRAYSHREPGVVGAAMDLAGHVELIADGIHVHPSVVRMVFAAFGPARVCLISDSMRAAGMPDGRYDLGGQAVTVRDGRAVIDNGSLAGSVANLFDCMQNAVAFGVARETAILAATRNPAVAAGLYDSVGSLTPGKTADLLILDRAFRLAGIIHHGRLLEGFPA